MNRQSNASRAPEESFPGSTQQSATAPVLGALQPPGGDDKFAELKNGIVNLIKVGPLFYQPFSG